MICLSALGHDQHDNAEELVSFTQNPTDVRSSMVTASCSIQDRCCITGRLISLFQWLLNVLLS